MLKSDKEHDKLVRLYSLCGRVSIDRRHRLVKEQHYHVSCIILDPFGSVVIFFNAMHDVNMYDYYYFHVFQFSMLYTVHPSIHTHII